ncbi:MAG: DUF4422 domain-containing protein, partial [Spirochaetaceae bacterium]|nr:DUF4422 domain-containing protein [Spirochaetaceae bacterium]
TGDNISEKRLSYNELTVMYWAWKNVKADYYGLCHYRRYFSFNSQANQIPGRDAQIHFDYINKDFLSQVNIDADSLITKMSGNALALCTPIDVRDYWSQNVYHQHRVLPHFHIKDIDILLNVIKDVSPRFYIAAKRFFNGHLLYAYNTFIMRKDLFFRYCEWLFPILQECEKRIDLSNYNLAELRNIGYLGEWCLGIFYTYINTHENIQATFFQRLFVCNTDVQAKVEPRFKEQTTIVTACSNEYVPYLAIMLQSLLENTSQDNRYGIYIMHTYIIEENQRRIKALCQNYANVYIEFYNMKKEVSSFSFKNSAFIAHVTNETFFRTLAHKVFKTFTKIIYLDIDIIIQTDVANLYNIDIGNNLMGACVDVDFIGAYFLYEWIKDYADNTLKLKEILKYFNAGILLLNIKQFRKEFGDYDLATFAVNGNYKFVDQDILNIACQKKVSFIDLAWNVPVYYPDRDKTIAKAPFTIYNKYLEARSKPKIIHYSGQLKPWNDPTMDFAAEFWEVARKSPFYEILLARMTKPSTQPVISAQQITDRIIIKRLLKRIIKAFLKKIITPFFPPKSKRRRELKKVRDRLRSKKR